MRFSVVITVFNLREYVGEATDSVLAQTRGVDEIVLVDDGSTDGSGEWLEKEYASYANVEVLRKPNGGQLSAFRAGLARCSGDVVCFLDGDDRWKPGYVERLERLYREWPAIDAVFGNLETFGRGEPSRWHPDAEDRDLGLSVLRTYLARSPSWEGSPTSALSLRRSLAEEVLSLPASFDPEWRIRADDVLVLGAALCGARRYLLAEPLVEYRAHDWNGWFGKEPDACELLAFKLRRHALVRHFGSRLEPTTGLSQLVKLELATKSEPRPKDLRIYLKILRNDRTMSWRRRWMARIKLRALYWSLRRNR